MEGDLFAAWLPALYPFALVMAALLGGSFVLLRFAAAKLLSDIDRKLGRLDQLAAELARLDQELRRLTLELPVHYVRRDDHIRDMTAISAKLDRIYEILVKPR